MKHELPKLNYSYDALEPWIDAKTMEIHYGKHHQAYADKMNAVLEKYPELAEKNPIELMKNLSNLPMDEKDRSAFKNNGGGYINHSLFWKVMGAKKEVDESLVRAVESAFGSAEEFKKIFSETALGQFGSGWAWLVWDENGKLKIYSTPNQDSPYSVGHTPVICLDVWEHSYYIKYQNRRAEYVENWWNILKLI